MVKIHITLLNGTTDQISFYDDDLGSLYFENTTECCDVERAVLADGITGEVLADSADMKD